MHEDLKCVPAEGCATDHAVEDQTDGAEITVHALVVPLVAPLHMESLHRKGVAAFVRAEDRPHVPPEGFLDRAGEDVQRLEFLAWILVPVLTGLTPIRSRFASRQTGSRLSEHPTGRS
jgi:hypothetical protein